MNSQALFLLCALLPMAACQNTTSSSRPTPVVLAIHGGAGTILRKNMSAENEAAYRAKLEEALRAGYAMLDGGSEALDAVTAAILVMEESPLFNSGHGAVLTSAGTCEMDASVMRGDTGMAGAVAGVTTTRNPILAARAVMEHSPHVLLSGPGADTFAREQGLEQVPNEFFQTDRRLQQLEKWRERKSATGSLSEAWEGKPDERHGTVGAVALDREGHLAAGTSTGGMVGKLWGRIGDSPILGAGTWAADHTCAVSGTGWGEFFMRGTIARDVAALMEFGGLDLEQAARRVVRTQLTEKGGTGGVIALDGQGRVSAPFNTAGMYRGWIDQKGRVEVHLYAPAATERR
ncbi:MAG: isoaspartyl peptidase/L-asparaginase [Planctomycetota bacterium]|nr:isoaspartyl peptidase/L-asparaginase [Planctomycetota bacterium]